MSRLRYLIEEMSV